MERSYYLYDRRIVVEQIANIVAVHIKTDARGELLATERSFGTSAVDTVWSTEGVQFPEEALDVFACELKIC